MENPTTAKTLLNNDDKNSPMNQIVLAESFESNFNHRFGSLEAEDYRNTLTFFSLGAWWSASLDRNLKTRLHYEIYKQLQSDNSLWPSPLVFLRLLNNRIRFIQKTKRQPLKVVSRLDWEAGIFGSRLSERQVKFLCEKLLEHFDEMRRADTSLDICCREIESRYSVSAGLKDFDERDMTGAEGENSVAADDARIDKPKLSVDQFIMLMFAIGGSRLKGLDKKNVAEGLSALTGYSATEFTKKFSQVLPSDRNGIRKFNEKPDAYNKDVEKVCDILKRMGLTDEVNKLKESSGV